MGGGSSKAAAATDIENKLNSLDPEGSNRGTSDFQSVGVDNPQSTVSVSADSSQSSSSVWTVGDPLPEMEDELLRAAREYALNPTPEIADVLYRLGNGFVAGPLTITVNQWWERGSSNGNGTVAANDTTTTDGSSGKSSNPESKSDNSGGGGEIICFGASNTSSSVRPIPAAPGVDLNSHDFYTGSVSNEGFGAIKMQLEAERQRRAQEAAQAEEQ